MADRKGQFWPEVAVKLCQEEGIVSAALSSFLLSLMWRNG